ncbi:hypothetical protein AJ87_15115 [Rhizobium yanglingense]|nr:hypothetical protein AJ87_15115 [Rhizobium yanglingense]
MLRYWRTNGDVRQIIISKRFAPAPIFSILLFERLLPLYVPARSQFGSGSWRCSQYHDREKVVRPTAGLYLILTIALSLACWSFIRSEYYRRETKQSLSQTFEALRISEEARVGIVRIGGWLRLASKTGEIEPACGQEMALVINNIDQLLTLDYMNPQDVDLLLRTRRGLETQVMPVVVSGRGVGPAARYMDKVEQRLRKISGLTAAHRRSVKEKAQIAIAATHNRFVFALALTLVAVAFIIIAQRAEFARRRDQYIRCFLSLHAHMTRSRVIAVRLFLDYLRDQTSPSPEMLRAAQNAMKELEEINSRLSRIAYSERDSRTEPLGKLLQGIHDSLDTNIRLDIDDKAQDLQVPAAQVQLMVEELVRNAVVAVRGKHDQEITIRRAFLIDASRGTGFSLKSWTMRWHDLRYSGQSSNAILFDPNWLARWPRFDWLH